MSMIEFCYNLNANLNLMPRNHFKHTLLAKNELNTIFSANVNFIYLQDMENEWTLNKFY